MRKRFSVSPRSFFVISVVALVALSVIVFTGAAVRLTGSGLGCPDWPQCNGKQLAPLGTHAWIEYGNRLIAAVLTVISFVAWIAAWLRKPYRRELFWIAFLLPLGVLAQGALGAITVIFHLSPIIVTFHYILSMLLLFAGVLLCWRAKYAPGERLRSSDRITVWSTRALLPIGLVTVFAGTVATAAGPHAGGAGTGDAIKRINFDGANTLEWAIATHGRIALAFGICVVIAWVVAWRRNAERAQQRGLTLLAVILAVQGAFGQLQYQLHLPAELVWIHVVFATITWNILCYTVIAAGRLVPRPDVAAQSRGEVASRSASA